MHPAFATNEIKTHIKQINQQIQISHEEFNLVLQKANILVGSTTTACVEALVYNVSILIVSNYFLVSHQTQFLINTWISVKSFMMPMI